MVTFFLGWLVVIGLCAIVIQHLTQKLCFLSPLVKNNLGKSQASQNEKDACAKAGIERTRVVESRFLPLDDFAGGCERDVVLIVLKC